VATTNTYALQEFCSRLRKPVFAFGQAFLGNGIAAEQLTYEVLLAVYRRHDGRLSDPELVPRALGIAFRSAQNYQPVSVRLLQNASRLEIGVLSLPRLERAVVIMRNLLRMDWESIGLATDLSKSRAHEVWVRGVVQLNELLNSSSSTESD
jgi:DNA-directed RNA polymerase specialized sigma24 family protein